MDKRNLINAMDTYKDMINILDNKLELYYNAVLCAGAYFCEKKNSSYIYFSVQLVTFYNIFWRTTFPTACDISMLESPVPDVNIP